MYSCLDYIEGLNMEDICVYKNFINYHNTIRFVGNNFSVFHYQEHKKLYLICSTEYYDLKNNQLTYVYNGNTCFPINYKNVEEIHILSSYKVSRVLWFLITTLYRSSRKFNKIRHIYIHIVEGLKISRTNLKVMDEMLSSILKIHPYLQLHIIIHSTNLSKFAKTEYYFKQLTKNHNYRLTLLHYSPFKNNQFLKLYHFCSYSKYRNIKCIHGLKEVEKYIHQHGIKTNSYTSRVYQYIYQIFANLTNALLFIFIFVFNFTVIYYLFIFCFSFYLSVIALLYLIFFLASMVTYFCYYL